MNLAYWLVFLFIGLAPVHAIHFDRERSIALVERSGSLLSEPSGDSIDLTLSQLVFYASVCFIIGAMVAYMVAFLERMARIKMAPSLDYVSEAYSTI